MIIRPETPRDYAVIADINARAFENRAAEAVIVALHRHRSRFDPDLSLVAEIDGQVVGHVLFSPQTIRLLGQNVEAVNLAPIAIHPDHQRKGIGAALIEEGHRIARTKGYALSFLLGHPEYYPRFGYKTHAYGAASVTAKLGEFVVPKAMEARQPIQEDIPVLREMWLREEGNVDFAIDPGKALLDWLSPNPATQSLVFVRGEHLIGYARIHGSEVRYLIARDEVSALIMVGTLAGDREILTLPLHPNSASAPTFKDPKAEAWEAGMVCPFVESPFDEYYRLVQSGQRQVGRPVWPVNFDME